MPALSLSSVQPRRNWSEQKVYVSGQRAAEARAVVLAARGSSQAANSLGSLPLAEALGAQRLVVRGIPLPMQTGKGGGGAVWTLHRSYRVQLCEHRGELYQKPS